MRDVLNSASPFNPFSANSAVCFIWIVRWTHV